MKKTLGIFFSLALVFTSLAYTLPIRAGAQALLTTPEALVAEDFGAVCHQVSENGTLSGYTAGFGLTDATLAGAKSVVVQLYSGTSTLLQTNTAILPTFNAIVTGVQFSSPFNVSGTFNYVTDGYWVNARESEYGQNDLATKVVATVTLENGKVVTATNSNLVGNPATVCDDNATSTVQVTIEKYIQGVMATAVTADNTDFPMSSEWDETNIGTGTGAYVLSETNSTPYHIVTSEMEKGTEYKTMELLDTDVVGAQCATGTPFALQGYTVGNTKAEALDAVATTSNPSFTNLQNDTYVIVWNRDCALPEVQIGGDGVTTDGILQVTSIDMIDSTATANGSFSDGWKYVFHITAPTSEENIAMKFSNWIKTGSNETIPVANNMRISSSQADNSGATVLLTAQDVYSTPELHMTGDLNPAMTGRQVEITVEVAIPNGTANGSFTTSYGVRSN